MLSRVAEILHSRCRQTDVVARYGGEEFAVIMPMTSADNAVLVAERLRQALWQRALPHTASRTTDRVTLSIGVATMASGETIAARKLASMADEALYVAKASGRNRVEQYDKDSAQLPSISTG